MQSIVRRWFLALICSGVCLGIMPGRALRAADEPAPKATEQKDEKKADAQPADTVKAAGDEHAAESGSSGKPASASKPKYPPHAEVLKEFKPVEGLLHLYKKDNKVLLEILPSQLNKDFMVLISIARGIGEGMLLGGMTWGFGDDWLWQFRKVDDNIQVVRRNVRFTAAKGSPEEKAVELAYTDSVLFSLPIVTMGPNGGTVVDLDQVFMSDLPQISRVLPGFAFSSNKSTWAAVKSFKDNSELEIAATYASSGSQSFDTVADSRGVTVNVHYSISLLPETGYQPRLADDRVGHFLTVIKDYSKKGDDDRFVRFINRWDLQKADPSAEISPPKKPIVFWIENTVPYGYRAAIRDGILEWNKAFEKAGFSNAVEVRQQPDNADWDPEDVNYNTFRWITASAGFAMGPSRVNPKTGQILDADIIFDADFVQFWKREYEIFTPESIAAMTGGPLTVEEHRAEMERQPFFHRHSHAGHCDLHHGMSRQLAFGALAMMAAAPDAATSAKDQEKLIMQGLKEVTMHEVGHTLGLRHNFKASAFLTLEEMNDREKTSKTGLTASVMDYAPVNLAPKGQKQGDFYSTTIGPYDHWAIEYAYKPFSGGTNGEVEHLKKIASRCAEPGHDYATDEDTRGIDPDPYVNRFDLGKNPIEYAKTRTKLTGELMPDVVKRVTKDGDGYQRSRQAFGVLLGNYGQATFMAARFIGGLDTYRDHKGDPNARPPFVVVPVEQQRAALALLEEVIFSEKPFNFPSELYNYMASTHWDHWGVNYPDRTDYAVHEVINMWQSRVLSQLLSSTTLERLYDSELKVPSDKEAFTTAELLQRLTQSTFSEVDKLAPGEFTDRAPAISSLRRNLQRTYVKQLASIAMGNTRAPEDCQAVAYAELSDLQKRIDGSLRKAGKLDAYSRAHLQATRDRIQKVLDADLSLSRP